ncbi:hypothetical protein H4R33_002190 [Dimargaris cristalligena]|nr:hypothetical protein H4R33_002190 [Dimargaris cristalligena]
MAITTLVPPPPGPPAPSDATGCVHEKCRRLVELRDSRLTPGPAAGHSDLFALLDLLRLTYCLEAENDRLRHTLEQRVQPSGIKYSNTRDKTPEPAGR